MEHQIYLRSSSIFKVELASVNKGLVSVVFFGQMLIVKQYKIQQKFLPGNFAPVNWKNEWN